MLPCPPGFLQRLGGALLALGLACQACSPRSSPALELVVPNELTQLDPRYVTQSADLKVTRLVHAGLTGIHPRSLEPLPLLAQSWQWEDVRTLEVTLKEGLHFHSGKALLPEDVCASLFALKDPKVGSPQSHVMEALDRCDPLPPNRVRIHTQSPRASLLTDLEVPILRADEASSPPHPRGDLDGLGPYRIRSLESGGVTLERVPGAEPSLPKELRVRTVRDENARGLRLLSGRTDLAQNAISLALLPALEHQSGLEVRSTPGANITYLLIDNARPPYDRVEVRRALAAALDRRLLVQTLFAGKARVARSLIPPGHWAEPKDLPELPYDPEAARRVLQGLPEVTLLTSSDRSRILVARAVAQMLTDAGLATRVVSLELGVLMARLDAGDYELGIMQLPEVVDPHVFTLFFHPRELPERNRGRNRARYVSARAGELLDQAGQRPEPQVRRELYGELMRLLQRDLPVIPLWHEDTVVILSRRAGTFQPRADARFGGF